MSELAEIKQELDDIGVAWEAFQAEANKEQKADREKLARLSDAMDTATDNIAKITTALNRTDRGPANDDKAGEQSPRPRSILTISVTVRGTSQTRPTRRSRAKK